MQKRSPLQTRLCRDQVDFKKRVAKYNKCGENKDPQSECKHQKEKQSLHSLPPFLLAKKAANSSLQTLRTVPCISGLQSKGKKEKRRHHEKAQRADVNSAEFLCLVAILTRYTNVSPQAPEGMVLINSIFIS